MDHAGPSLQLESLNRSIALRVKISVFQNNSSLTAVKAKEITVAVVDLVKLLSIMLKLTELQLNQLTLTLLRIKHARLKEEPTKFRDIPATVDAVD